MNSLQYTTQSMKFSTYMALEGTFGFNAAIDYNKIISNFIKPNKDLYIDLKGLKSIDILGLNALITTKCLVKAAGGDFYIFIDKDHSLIELMDKIKLKNQLNFRDIIIQDSCYSIAS